MAIFVDCFRTAKS